VRVTAALAGGFAISIDNPNLPPVVVVPDLFQTYLKQAIQLPGRMCSAGQVAGGAV
jgi:hypothetical protein